MVGCSVSLCGGSPRVVGFSSCGGSPCVVGLLVWFSLCGGSPPVVSFSVSLWWVSSRGVLLFVWWASGSPLGFSSCGFPCVVGCCCFVVVGCCYFVVVGFCLCFFLAFFNAKNSDSHTTVPFARHTKALCEGRAARSRGREHHSKLGMVHYRMLILNWVSRPPARKIRSKKPARLKQAGIAHYSRTQRRAAYLVRCTMAIFREGSCLPRSSWQSLRRRNIALRTAHRSSSRRPVHCVHLLARCNRHGNQRCYQPQWPSRNECHQPAHEENLDFLHCAVDSQALPITGQRRQPASFRRI